jgi:polysaccharide pyruvyl transferase WcaK-like protein
VNNCSNICLLGASFSTGNLGVSALAWSSIKLLKQKSSKATISIIGAGREISTTEIKIDGKIIPITIYPIRYTPNIFVDNHILRIYLHVLLLKLFPSLKRAYQSNNTLSVMINSDLFCDITGGDSFSDIYGFVRFFKVFLLKRAAQLMGNPFVMLPQTYGPFKGRLCQFLAKIILKKSQVILSRDKEGITVVESLLGKTTKLQLCPDVAFLLEPIVFNYPLMNQIQTLKNSRQAIIGLNISGLLYNGGYSGKNEFGLVVDYQPLIKSIIQKFTTRGMNVLLVPHVFSKDNLGMECDVNACRLIYDNFPKEIQAKLLFSEQAFNQSEAKYLIGQCDFFMGARMHACIAAFSQHIPTIGMAYSKKFAGVFETVGILDCVMEMTNIDNTSALALVDSLYQQRQQIRQQLKTSIPQTQKKVTECFNSW